MKLEITKTNGKWLVNKMKTVVAQINETFKTKDNQTVADYYNNNL